ncbi:MAG: lipid-A-disaccharide synthase N-terminal domain-containing protein [Pirellulaceae bacterium]|nr:lipid-A-disaccharide synthase N-terminal domain-containing protein [Pirellulaceae bacterium]
MTRRPDGSYRYVLTDDQGVRHLTAEQFADRLYRDHTSQTLLQLLFNISGPIGITWVGLGFLGQAMFTGRMLVQWIVSEKKRQSVVPVAFWWMSLIGGVMLLTYFIWRKDIVGVAGQSTGLLVYGRNLILIRRRRGTYDRRSLRS